MEKKKKPIRLDDFSPEMQKEILKNLEKREKRRKFFSLLCGLIAASCFLYVFVYYYFADRTEQSYSALRELKENSTEDFEFKDTKVVVNLTGEKEAPEVLEEYKNLLIKNKSLIGWLKIDDTIIDYPVMQTQNNDYYLDHNISQEYDKNGSIFMDCACDVLKPSTNLILYGHHMKSGKMFGDLDLYESKEYYKEHPVIQFDTIYEKGTYEVVFVFRSKVYHSEEITFKYYQFIDANSEDEFYSYMNSMKEISLYDTGVPVSYGDRFLTLSTCDNSEAEGRFVVVAKRVE